MFIIIIAKTGKEGGKFTMPIKMFYVTNQSISPKENLTRDILKHAVINAGFIFSRYRTKLPHLLLS